MLPVGAYVSQFLIWGVWEQREGKAGKNHSVLHTTIPLIKESVVWHRLLADDEGSRHELRHELPRRDTSSPDGGSSFFYRQDGAPDVPIRFLWLFAGGCTNTQT